MLLRFLATRICRQIWSCVLDQAPEWKSTQQHSVLYNDSGVTKRRRWRQCTVLAPSELISLLWKLMTGALDSLLTSEQQVSLCRLPACLFASDCEQTTVSVSLIQLNWSQAITCTADEQITDIELRAKAGRRAC